MDEKEIQATVTMSSPDVKHFEQHFTKVTRFSEDAETNNLTLELSDENGTVFNITFNKKANEKLS